MEGKAGEQGQPGAPTWEGPVAEDGLATGFSYLI